MAKQENFDFDDWGDWEDFDDFNDGMGEGDFKSTTKVGKAREAVTALSGGLVSGVKESLFSRSFYQSVVSKALPREYSVALDGALNIKDAVEDVYDSAVRESENINDKLTKGVKPFVDKYSDKLPLRLKGPLRKWTSNVRSSNEWTQENKDELDAVATINDIFNKKEQSKALKSNSVESKVQTSLAKGQLGLTSQMAEAQQRILAYQDQIDANWKRKSLELQYKQFFVQRKILDVQQQHLKFHMTSSADIIKNTGLPDIVKAENSELAGRVVKEKLYGYAFNKFSALPLDIVSRLGRNIVTKMRSSSADIQGFIADKLEAAYDGVEQAEDYSEFLGDADRYREGGNLASAFASEGLASYIGKKLGKKLKDNEKIRNGANMLSGMSQRLPRMMNTYIRNGEGSGLVDMLLELMDADQVFSSDSTQIMSNHSTELDSVAYFDLLTKKSITEIIPGYLTRIHHEIRSLRTGDDTLPLLGFDFDKGVFSNESKLKATLKEKVLGNRPKTQMKRVHDDLMKDLGMMRHDKDANNGAGADIFELDPAIIKVFLEEFSIAALNNEDFTLKSLMSNDSGKLDDEQLELLSEFLKNKFGIEDDDWDNYLTDGFVSGIKKRITSVKNMSPEALKAQRAIVEGMSQLQRDLNNPTGTLIKTASQGRINHAHGLGITEEDNGVYSLNRQKYIKLLMGEIERGFEEEEGEEEENKETATKRYLKDLSESLKRKVKSKVNPDAGDGEDSDIPNDDTDISPDESDESEDIAPVNRNRRSRQRVRARAKQLGEVLKDKLPTPKSPSSSSNENQRNLRRNERKYRSFFTETRVAEYKAMFGVNDRITKLMNYVKDKTGKEDITSSDIAKAYQNDDVVREMVSVIEEESQVNSKKTQRDRNKSDIKQDVTQWFNGSFKRKNKSKPASATPAEPKDADIQEAEDYAEAFIENNDIEDAAGTVKTSIMRAYLKDRFMGSRWYSTMSTAGHLFSGSVKTAKRSSDKVRATGVNDNVFSVVQVLLEMSKFGAKAANVASKPGRTALKLIPWGLKKIVNAVTDIVNFQHVQHALWLKGEDEPRLLKTGLMNGRYINGDGDIIEKPTDIKGDIYDGMTTPHELIMSKSEYKGGLYDSTGKLIYKPPSLIKRISSGIAKLPWKIAKGTAKIAGKALMGYLKVTTKPVTWFINRILREDRIEPKLHAELVHLGLTEQTNQRLDQLSEMIDKKLPDVEEKKFNDVNGDGHRDGSYKDIVEKRKTKKEEKEARRKEEKEAKEKKKNSKDKKEGGLLGGLADGLTSILGKGKGLMGGAMRALANPYVLGGVAIASLFGWELFRDGARSKDEDDVSQQLPEGLKDNKAARIGVRVTEKIVDWLVLAPAKAALKGVIKTTELATRFLKWGGRKTVRGLEKLGGYLGAIPGRAAGALFGSGARQMVDKLLQIDNINPLFRFRMAQYGFDYKDNAAVNAVLKMEDDILKTLIEATESQGARIDNSITVEQCAAYFGVSINSEENLVEWIAWFKDRFRPVFLSSVTILKRMGHLGRDLHNVDALLTKDEKLDYINKVHFYRIEENPYDAIASPIGSESKLEIVGTDAVQAARKEHIADIKKMPDDPKKIQEAKQRAANRDRRRLDQAQSTLKDVKPAKRFDPYKLVDKISFKNHMKIASAVRNGDLIMKDIDSKPKMSGSGAGETYAKSQTPVKPKQSSDSRSEEQRRADLEEHGLVGEAALKTSNFIGSLFMKQAHASAFMPEVQYGGATAPMGYKGGEKMVLPGAKTSSTPTKTTTSSPVLATPFKPNSPSGSSALGVHDRPVKAATFARRTAKPTSSGTATRAIKEALNKAGYVFKAPAAASDYPANALPDMGFIKIANNTPWIVGDIIVYTSSREYSQGHIQIYDGANWISDHIQQDVNPFNKNAPTYTLWRDVKFSMKGTAAPKEMALSDEVDKALEQRNLKVDQKGDLVSKTKSTSSSDSGTTASKPEKKEKEKGVVARAWDKTKDAASGLADKIGNIGSDIADKIKGFFSGNNAGGDTSGSPEVSGGAPAGDNTVVMSGSQKQWQLMVYKAFKNAGFSEQQSRILTAEIGRENSYNPNLLFGGHKDPHKGMNLGMLSWQGTRRPKLVKWLTEAGVMGSGKITQSQAALDAQARFIMHEMKTSYPNVAKKFLANPNISYKDGAWIVGKEFIAWRITDPKYAGPGIRNRDGFYNMLLKQLGAKDGDAGSSTTAATASATASTATSKTASKTSTTKTTAATPTGSTTTAKSKTSKVVSSLASNVTSSEPVVPKNQADSAAGNTAKNANSAMPAGAPPIKAAQYARRNAARASKGQCAKYVRLALQSAGYSFTSQTSAYMYANGTLSSMGYGQISTSTPWQVGDVVVIKNSGPHPHGHICIWDGSNWISDFVQSNWNVYRGEQFWTLWRDRRYLAGAQASTGPTSSSTGKGAGPGAGGASGEGGAPSAPQYATVKMKYTNRNSGEVDTRIKDTWAARLKGEKTKSQIARDEKRSTDKVTAVNAKADTSPKTNDATKTKTQPTSTTQVNPTQTKSTPTTKPPVGSSFAPSLPFGAQSLVDTGSSNGNYDLSTINPLDWFKQQQVEEKTSKTLTEKMSEAAVAQSNADIAESSRILRESLMVQTRMLDKLTSIEAHMVNVARNAASRNITESSGTSTPVNDKPTPATASKPEYRVERPSRNEPMSMSKIQ